MAALTSSDPEGYTWLVPPIPMPPAGRIEIVDSLLTENASGGGGAAVNNQGSGTIFISHSIVEDNPGAHDPGP